MGGQCGGEWDLVVLMMRGKEFEVFMGCFDDVGDCFIKNLGGGDWVILKLVR